METQAQPTLRPLRLGELLDRAIRLYRGNFLTFIGIIAVVYVPLMVLQTASTALMNSSISNRMSSPQDIFTNYGYWGGFLAVIILAFVRFVLVQGIANGALARAVADSYMGRETSILDAYRGIGNSWLSLVGALLLLILILIGLFIWWVLVPCIGWFTGFGMLLFVGAVINPLVPPAIVLEKQGAVESIQRAWSLARRRFWPLLGYVVVLYLFSIIIVNGPATIASILLAQVVESISDTSMQLIVTSVIQGLVALVFILIYYPLQMTAFTLIYFDLRVRTEGFDLAILTMETSGSTDLTEAMTAPMPQVNEKLITGTELGNFAILTLAGAGLYILFTAFIAAIMLFSFSLMG